MNNKEQRANGKIADNRKIHCWRFTIRVFKKNFLHFTIYILQL